MNKIVDARRDAASPTKMDNMATFREHIRLLVSRRRRNRELMLCVLLIVSLVLVLWTISFGGAAKGMFCEKNGTIVY